LLSCAAAGNGLPFKTHGDHEDPALTTPRSIVRLAPVASLALLAGCATRPPLPDPLEAGWNDAPVCERLHEDSDQRILRCTFPPGVGHERHFHARHFGYALSGGRMRITDANGTREVDLATGSSFTSPGVAWHEAVNVGDTTVTYLIVEPQ
jgi:quercetin dioxygenase-like cupin family protein